ncbi:MAG: flavin reductase family protein [Colwellia sp.]|nr:flavin reductase family protein [Colwellia sp.]
MFTNGVSIILTGSNDDYHGMAIAWVSQVEKEHLIISIPKGSSTSHLLLEQKKFSVNELAVGQEDLARQFGGQNCQGKPSINLAQIKFTEHNLPIILNCCSSTVCEVLKVSEINDQIVVTAKIICSQSNLDLLPLIFDKSAYFK